MRFLFIGDSRTARGNGTFGSGNNSWPAALVAQSNVSQAPNIWIGDNVGNSGTSSINWAANIAATLALQTSIHVVVLCNVGVLDVATPQATYIANMQSVMDACAARWPSLTFYCMRPWRQGQDAFATTIHGWIDTLVASRPFAALGPDEAVWMKGADNGATMSNDGLHYSAAGEVECAAQWLTTLGF